MRITEIQLAILELLTWHVRAATDSQIQQVLNDQSIPGHASAVLRRLTKDGWIHRRRINVAVPVLSKPLCSWSPNQSKPNFAILAWQLFVRHTNNGRCSSSSCYTDHGEINPRQPCHPTQSLSISQSVRTGKAVHREPCRFSTDQTPALDSLTLVRRNQACRRPRLVNWAAPKAAHLTAGVSGWGRQPLQIEHDLGTTAMYVSSRPYQSEVIWYGEDIVRRRFSGVKKKVPDALLVDRRDNILKVMEFGGQYSRKRLEDFHRTWQPYPWEIW
ncbi:hypothetical protein [Fuerstiella marisgermanici]|nr:hypothetical protein [Fuerstiella marisgermanici]